MAEKRGGGGKLQEYNENNGEYGSGHEDNKRKKEEAEKIYNSDYNSDRIVFDEIIDKKLKTHQALSDEEIDVILEVLAKTYERPERNVGDKNLKKILDINGFSGTPRRVGKDKLLQVLSDGVPLFRGLNGDKAVEYAKQFYDGEMYVGIGLGGNGIYMSIDGNEANSYSKGSNVIVTAIMPKDMKIAGKEVRQEFSVFSDKYKTTTEQSKTEKERLWAMQKPLSFGTYCALKGYDAYLPTINPKKNMVVLNRSKLVIGANNEQERLLELS